MFIQFPVKFVSCFLLLFSKSFVLLRVRETDFWPCSSESMDNKTNAEISCCQTAIQEFGRQMKGRFHMKGNKDNSIPKKYSDGEENVNC